MTVDALADVVAKETKLSAADVKKSFAKIIKRQEALEPDRLGNTSATIEALRGALPALDRDARRRIVSAVVALAVANPKASVFVKTFTWNGAGDGLELCRDVLGALVLFDAGLEPLDWLEKGGDASLAKLRPRAIARREVGDAWALDLDVLGMGSGATELTLATRLFTLLALPCETDEEVVRLALDATGPGSQGYEHLLACAAWLRERHAMPAPRVLDPSPGWDGGGKEKAQGTYELLHAAQRVAPSLVPEIAVKLFGQSWAPKRAPGLWLAFAEQLEDHVSKGEGRYLGATARAGDVHLKFSRGKVTIDAPKKRLTGTRSTR